MRFFCTRERHLICYPYSVANLHRMAKHLRLNKHWFHSGNNACYKIPVSRTDIPGLCEVVSKQSVLEMIKFSR